MKTQSTQSYLWLFLALTLFHAGCRNKAPDGFSADFEIIYNNGGMAPDLITLRAQFADADTYDWSIESNSMDGREVTFPIQTAGSYYVTLELESGKHKKTKSTSVVVENYPTNGDAMTVVQGDGVIGTTGLGGAQPFFVPIDTIANGGIAGMDYDDDTKELYYTGSIIRAFPNGAEKKVIFSDDQLSGGDNIVDLVVDSDDHRVYFAINSSEFFINAIASIDQDGNDLNYVAQFEFPNSIFDITLDEIENTVYLTSYDNSGIYQTIPGEVSLIYSDQRLKYALVFDNSTGNLYFAEQVFTPEGIEITNILRFNPKNYNPDLSETWPQIVVENASTQPIHGIDISESKQQLYWSDTGQNVIYRIDLNNPQAEREIIFTDVTNPRAIAISNFH